jgi:GNAT superfamily N-acetyltransferase
MKSHWAKYKEERTNAIVIEDEHGFASACKLDDWFYIEDIYVIPEQRLKNNGAKYIAKLIDIAQELGYKKVLCSVCNRTKGATANLHRMLSIGFELAWNSGSIIYVKGVLSDDAKWVKWTRHHAKNAETELGENNIMGWK